MKYLLLTLISFSMMMASCEKEDYYDPACAIKKPGSNIDGWGTGDTTKVTEPKDTAGGFYVEVESWGDSIHETNLLK